MGEVPHQGRRIPTDVALALIDAARQIQSVLDS
jgi:hypothetical protein